MNTRRVERAIRYLAGLAAVVLGLGLPGCGGDSGPPRYGLSGSVTYGNQPVPAGYIVFAPDKSKGNDGPGSQADIKDGRYETPPGQGTIGGPHLVTISGFDGKPIEMGGGQKNLQGSPLFTNYQTSADLPKKPGTHDFSVPAGGKK